MLQLSGDYGIEGLGDSGVALRHWLTTHGVNSARMMDERARRRQVLTPLLSRCLSALISTPKNRWLAANVVVLSTAIP